MTLTRTLRYSRGAGKVFRAHFGRLSHPLKLTFAATYWCQYQCQTCNIWKKRPTDELTTDEILTFIARNSSPSWIDVTGGEIFLRADIEEVLGAMVRSWRDLLLLHYPTNGFQTDRIAAVTERLARQSAVPIVVTVSVDGDQVLNDEVRGIKGGYARQIETFNRLRQLRGVRVVIGFTLSDRNAGSFDRALQSWRRDCPGLEPRDVHLNVMQLSDHYYLNGEMAPLLPKSEQTLSTLRRYRAGLARAHNLPTWVESRYLDHLEQFVATGNMPMRCHSLRSSCFIDPWGTVYPCITYSRSLGSLRETAMELAPIWNGERATTTQREIWNDECPRCWTACEAYQSILGNMLRPGSPARASSQPITRQPDGVPRTSSHSS